MPTHVDPIAGTKADVGLPSLHELANSIVGLSLRRRSVDSLVEYCASRLDIQSSAEDAHRVICIRLSALTGRDDTIIRKLGALEAQGVLTAETVVRLALARPHAWAGEGHSGGTNQKVLRR